jgi:hypothetical protein
MTIYKSTKIGLAVAGFALAAQLVNAVSSDDHVVAPSAQPQKVTASTAFSECMNTRSGRSYEERSAVARGATERKSRAEIYAEREAKCNATLNAASAPKI